MDRYKEWRTKKKTQTTNDKVIITYSHNFLLVFLVAKKYFYELELCI